MHEQTTNTDWAFHFLLYIPMIREAVVYFPHYDFDLILVFKWLKRDLKKKRRKKLYMFFVHLSVHLHLRNIKTKVRFSLHVLRILKDEMINCISLLLDWIKTVITEGLQPLFFTPVQSAEWACTGTGPVCSPTFLHNLLKQYCYMSHLIFILITILSLCFRKENRDLFIRFTFT